MPIRNGCLFRVRNQTRFGVRQVLVHGEEHEMNRMRNKLREDEACECCEWGEGGLMEMLNWCCDRAPSEPS